MSLWHFPLLLTSSFSFTWQDCVICVAVPPPPFFSSSTLAALIVTDTITKGRQMWPMRSAIGYKVVTYMIWKVLILIWGLLLNWKNIYIYWRSQWACSPHSVYFCVYPLPQHRHRIRYPHSLEGLSLAPLNASTVFFFTSSFWCLSGFTHSGALAPLYIKIIPDLN